MAKTRYGEKKDLIKRVFLDDPPLTGVAITIDTVPESVHDKRSIYSRLYKQFWPKEMLIGDIFDFIARAAFANEATEWVEVGRTEDGVAFMKVQFNSSWAAERLAFNLLGQSGLRAVVEKENDQGLYRFEFEE